MSRKNNRQDKGKGISFLIIRKKERRKKERKEKDEPVFS